MHGNLLNEDYRAGGPTLVAIPAQYVRLPRDHPVRAIEDNLMVHSIWGVLADYGVDVTDMDLVGRQSLR